MKYDVLLAHRRFCQEAELQNYRPSTIQWWERAFSMLLAHFQKPGLRKVSDITLDRLQTYFIAKRASGWSAHTYSNQYRALDAFLKWCVRRDLASANPLEAIPRPKLEKKLPKRISAQDAQIVLDYAFYGPATFSFKRYRNRAILAVMLYAGLRLSETVNLETRDIDLAHRTLFVRCGKGAKDRLIPIGGTLAAYLESYLQERNRLERSCVSLFTMTRADIPFSATGLKRMIAQISRATGIRFSAHRLRHTFATMMLEGGCDLFSLKEMMGHSRVETTLGYLSATTQHLAAQITKHPLEQEPRTAPRTMPGAFQDTWAHGGRNQLRQPRDTGRFSTDTYRISA
ncbi:MAG: tyrosine-type recombinase/integrase [Myxococcota bacterium]